MREPDERPELRAAPDTDRNYASGRAACIGPSAATDLAARSDGYTRTHGHDGPRADRRGYTDAAVRPFDTSANNNLEYSDPSTDECGKYCDARSGHANTSSSYCDRRAPNRGTSDCNAGAGAEHAHACPTDTGSATNTDACATDANPTHTNPANTGSPHTEPGASCTLRNRIVLCCAVWCCVARCVCDKSTDHRRVLRRLQTRATHSPPP